MPQAVTPDRLPSTDEETTNKGAKEVRGCLATVFGIGVVFALIAFAGFAWRFGERLVP